MYQTILAAFIEIFISLKKCKTLKQTSHKNCINIKQQLLAHNVLFIKC